MRHATAHPPANPEQRPQNESPAARAERLAAETLIPAQPPGRVTRKARHYVDQIVRLRAEGYTFEAIQQSLAAVGVTVSIGTVRRESMRTPSPFPSSTVSCGGQLPVAPGLPSSDVSASVIPTGRTPLVKVPAMRTESSPTPNFPRHTSAKDLAAAYASSMSGNELIRAKEKS